MTMLSTRLIATILAAAGTSATMSQPAATTKPTTTITIYSSAQPGAIPAAAYRPTPASMGLGDPWRGSPLPGYALVKTERPITLKSGRNTLRFTDVAALIDPTTVLFESLTAPATTRVIEQAFQFDLVSAQKMLERFVGRDITLNGAKVKLLSASPGNILVEEGGSIVMVNDLSKASIAFPTSGSTLITEPTLVWSIQAQQEGEHRTRVSYQTEGITWWADYNLVFAEGQDANSGTLDVGAWVSILNRSGARYEDARLKLVAGDVQRAQPQHAPGRFAFMRAEMADAGEPGFEQKSFFEYHLYTLGRTTTIDNDATMQMELFKPAQNVPAEKVLVYAGQNQVGLWGGNMPINDRSLGTESNTKVEVYLRFKNDKDKGLGIPLPAGRVRVSKVDPADKSMEFIGEDTITHTPQGEDVLIKMGSAFDVVGERTSLSYEFNEARRRIDETVQVKVRNRKAEPVTVLVKESMHRWTTWEITQKTHEFKKVDSRTAHFTLTLKPDEEGVITYTVRYTW